MNEFDDRHIRAVDRRPAAWPRTYLGEGISAVFDGVGIWLTAEDVVRATDAIYLEPEVLRALHRFVRAVGAGPRPSA